MLVEPSVAFVIEAYDIFFRKLKNTIVNSELVEVTISNLTLQNLLGVLNENIWLNPHQHRIKSKVFQGW